MVSFAEILKGLYSKKMITEEKVDAFLVEKKITEKEHRYILGKEGNQS